MNSSYLWFNSASRNLGNDGIFSCQLNKQTQQCIPPTTTTPVVGTLFNNTDSPEFGIDTNTLLDSLDPSTAKNIFYIKNDACDIHIMRAPLMTTDNNSPSASSELLQPETFMTFKHNFYVSTNMEDSCSFNNSTTLEYKDLGITGFAFEPSMNPDDYDDNDNNNEPPSLYVSWKANTLNCSTPYNHSSYDDYYDKFRYTIGVSKILTNVPGCVVGDSSTNDTIPSWGNGFDDTMWRRCTQVMATFYNGCNITDARKTDGGGFGCSDLRCVDGGDKILDYYDENNTTTHLSVDPFRNGFSVDDIEGGPFIDYREINDTRNEIWVAGVGATPDDVVTIGDPIGINETDIVWMDNYNAYDAGTIRLRPNLNTLATEAVCWSTMLGIYCRGLSFGNSGSVKNAGDEMVIKTMPRRGLSFGDSGDVKNAGDEMTIETKPLELALTAQDMADICGLDYLPRYVTGMAVDWSSGDGAGGSDVFDTIYFGCAYNYDLPGNFASVDAAGHVHSMLEGEKGDNGGYWPGSVLFGPFGGVVPDESSGYVACPFTSNHSPLSSLVLSALIMISVFHHLL